MYSWTYKSNGNLILKHGEVEKVFFKVALFDIQKIINNYFRNVGMLDWIKEPKLENTKIDVVKKTSINVRRKVEVQKQIDSERTAKTNKQRKKEYYQKRYKNKKTAH